MFNLLQYRWKFVRVNGLWYFSSLFYSSCNVCESIKPCIKYYCWSVNKSTRINQVTALACLPASMPCDSTNVDILLHQFSRLLTLQRLIRLRDLICFDVNACSRRSSKREIRLWIKIRINKLHFAHVNKLWSNIHNNDYTAREGERKREKEKEGQKRKEKERGRGRKQESSTVYAKRFDDV